MTVRHSSLVSIVALIGGLAVAASGQAPDQDSPQVPSFRTGVDVVSLNVTVTDGTGAGGGERRDDGSGQGS